MGGGGVGGNPLWVYFHIGYRILDIYVYRYTRIFEKKSKSQKIDEIDILLMCFESHRRSESNPNNKIGKIYVKNTSKSDMV